MNDHDHASCSGYDADTSQDVCKDCSRRCPRDIREIENLRSANAALLDFISSMKSKVDFEVSEDFDDQKV